MQGILFKPDMIKAIVEGRKTVTRRVIKDKDIKSSWVDNDGEHILAKPRYQVGETVYIKEAYRYIQNDGDPFDFGIQYKSDSQVKWWRDNGNIMDYPIDEKWRSPLFLKEMFARYFIKITDVRAERLQEIEITPSDCIKEGSHWPTDKDDEGGFINLWDTIKKPPYDWASNPWVWRYEFEKVDH